MAAYFTVELDTTAPVATLGSPGFNRLSRILTVPYTVDEVGILSADFASDSGEVLPMGITGTDLTVQIPSGTSRAGEVRVRTQDEALNAAEYRRAVVAFLEILDSAAAAVARLGAMVMARVGIGSGSGGSSQAVVAQAAAAARYGAVASARRP